MEQKPVRDFYQIQETQAKTTRTLFAALVLFYIAAAGGLFFGINLLIGIVFARPRAFSAEYLLGLLGLACLFSLAFVAFQYYDARRNGARFILKRLNAKPPDLRDRYHRICQDVVEEMRIAAGFSQVRAYVIPDHAINSLALIEADGTPCVAMTEGMLAEFARDELQAVAGHELAHIRSGDTVFLTLVCSLADIFERLSDGLRSRDVDRGQEISSLSAILMKLLSRFIGREREIMADAAAVELSRSPVALARAITKAHLKNSFVGDFSLTYAPLFIVAPAIPGDPENDGRLGGWVGTHPPLMRRIRLLADMAGLSPDDIIRQVWEMQTQRDAARTVEGRVFGSPHDRDLFPRASTAEVDPRAKPGAPAAVERGRDETLRLPPFARRKSNGQVWKDSCPRCREPLRDTAYEGVPIRTCGSCGGKLLNQDVVERILARREVSFSPALRLKAAAFRERFLRNPIKSQKIGDLPAGRPPCPRCGYKMVLRPFNYQYFVPVEKCLSCYEIWFDADELEILQILVEDAKAL